MPTGTRKKKKKKKLPAWAHMPVYAGVRLGTTALPLLGVQQSMRFMRDLGGGFGSLPFNRERLGRAIDNISWCFPGWTEQEARRCAVESYRHLFSLAAEICVTPRMITEEGYASHIEFGNVERALSMLLEGRPCLMITGHCGNWELLGYAMAMLGFPVHALYRPLDMKPLDRWVQETRRRRGLDLVDKFGAADVLPALLERGETLGFIADQNAGDGGLFVPFFNRLASAYKTIGILALRYETPIVCGHARRLSGIESERSGHALDNPPSDRTVRSQVFRYRVEVPDIIMPEDWRDQPDPLYYITARYRRAIEQMVRRAPEQYLWMHRYWKSRPVHERKGRDFPERLRAKVAGLPWLSGEDVEQIVRRSAIDAEEYARRWR